MYGLHWLQKHIIAYRVNLTNSVFSNGFVAASLHNDLQTGGETTDVVI